MTDKSYVGMGAHICPVCTKRHDEVVLIDRRLRETLTKDEIIGFELCEEHAQMQIDGYVALIGVDESKSNHPYDIASVYRTGKFAHVRSEVFQDIFGTEVPKNPFTLAMCPDEVFDQLSQIPVEGETNAD